MGKGDSEASDSSASEPEAKQKTKGDFFLMPGRFRGAMGKLLKGRKETTPGTANPPSRPSNRFIAIEQGFLL